MQSILKFLHKRRKLRPNIRVLPIDQLKVNDDPCIPSINCPVHNITDIGCRLCRAGNLWLGGRLVNILRKFLFRPATINSYCHECRYPLVSCLVKEGSPIALLCSFNKMPIAWIQPGSRIIGDSPLHLTVVIRIHCLSTGNIKYPVHDRIC